MMRNTDLYAGPAHSLLAATSWAQPDRWQQRVKYTMDVAMNVTTNRLPVNKGLNTPTIHPIR